MIAISSRCVHVGCPVRWVAASESFICPCHGGVYDFRGLRIGGPPPRPLDRFYTVIRGGQVFVGPRFSVNNELRRFSPRDPGQPLDGIGQFLYPARFSTPPAPPGPSPDDGITAEAPASLTPCPADVPTSTTYRRGDLLRCVVDRGFADVATPRSPFSSDWRTVKMRHTRVETAMAASLVGSADNIDLARLTGGRF